MKMFLNVNIHKAPDKNGLHFQAWNLSPSPSMIQFISGLAPVLVY